MLLVKNPQIYLKGENMQNVWITPIKEMWINERKVIKILCEPNQQDIRLQNQQKSELGKSKRRPVKHIGSGKVYPSLIEAARAHGVSASSISRVCNEKQLTTQGHKFIYQ